MVKPVTVTVLPLVIAAPTASTVISPPEPVNVTEPCAPQVVPSLAYSRNDWAVPEAVAAADHVPCLALLRPDAAAIQSAGRVMLTKTPAGSAAAQLAGSAPEKIFSTAVVPICVSKASSCALPTATEVWNAT